MASKKTSRASKLKLQKVPPFTDDELIETVYLANSIASLLKPSRETDADRAAHMRRVIQCVKRMMSVVRVLESNAIVLEKAEKLLGFVSDFPVLKESKKKAKAKAKAKKTSKKA